MVANIATILDKVEIKFIGRIFRIENSRGDLCAVACRKINYLKLVTSPRCIRDRYG